MTQQPLPFQLGLEEVFAIAPGVTDTEAPELCAQIAFTYWDTLHKLGYITEPPDLGVIMDLTTSRASFHNFHRTASDLTVQIRAAHNYVAVTGRHVTGRPVTTSRTRARVQARLGPV